MEMCKTLLGFAHFHRHGWHEPKTTKPDRSFATKTGHFHLLLTANERTEPTGFFEAVLVAIIS